MVQPAFTTGYRTEPYLTYGEYVAAPTALDIGRLKTGGTAGDQKQVLCTLILEASGIVDNICNQFLDSRLVVEAARTRVNRQGEININTRLFPVLELRDFEAGVPGSMTSFTLANAWLEERGFTIPPSGLVGVGQFNSGYGYGSGRLMARWSYVNGYPVTRLAASAVAGASTISVIDATGIYGEASQLASSLLPGPSQLVLSDPSPSSNETVSVASVAGNVLTLNNPLLFNHAVTAEVDGQVGVSDLPPIIRKAVVLLTNTLIQTRGDGAIVAPSIAQGGYNARTQSPRSRKATDANQELAKEWLCDYTVVA